jgi:pyruvate/2-oxoglutarate dehydrogenase complex dihydrolipoamide dehydrogenase (E3) component
MTSSYEYDLVVIGAGPAGEKGAAQACANVARTASITRSTRTWISAG